ncbi:hypothetical protein GALMADRAFT_209946 [Galerina marginata CBS 339.88]|uniref:Uncharacterized protein n=1 Tax=Galerina marginata (strain CBS 339.88) TaxID=685588 RepID=A0A067TFA8_GALM3|nr:hypothetical protein GALMADRAFT_209946 [Galerina marginata CBS 339.88]
MPVGIVEVVNNTNGVLHYQNTESGYSFTVNPKTHIASDSDGWIPKSVFHDDTVPYDSSGKFINIWIGDGPKLQITDSDWQFLVRGPSDFVGHMGTTRIGSLSNGGQYIVKVDPDLGTDAQLSFIKYEKSKFQTTDAGQVISNTYLTLGEMIGKVILALAIKAENRLYFKLNNFEFYNKRSPNRKQSLSGRSGPVLDHFRHCRVQSDKQHIHNPRKAQPEQPAVPAPSGYRFVRLKLLFLLHPHPMPVYDLSMSSATGKSFSIDNLRGSAAGSIVWDRVELQLTREKENHYDAHTAVASPPQGTAPGGGSQSAAAINRSRNAVIMWQCDGRVTLPK